MPGTEAQVAAAPPFLQLSAVRSAQTMLWRALAVVFLGCAVGGLLTTALGIQNAVLFLLADSVVVSILCLPGLFRAILRPTISLAREQAAASAEARFWTIAQAVSDGIVIFDQKKTILFANQAAEQMHGYSRGALLGANMESLIPEDWRERFHKAMAQRLDSTQGAIRGEGLREVAGLRRNGESFPLEVRVNALPENDTVNFVVLMREITARKKAEEALRESEALFHWLANSAPVMIWTSDTSGNCTFFNKQWLDFRGRTLEEEQGNGWEEGVHPDDLPHIRQIYKARGAGRTAYETEFRLRRADGEYFWFLERGVPRIDPDGNYAGTIGSCIDVTLRKQAEEALRKSELKFRTFLESLPVAVRIIQNGVFVFANLADARLHGYDLPAEEYALESPISQIVPEERSRVTEYARRRERGDEVPDRFEVRRLRRDGSDFPAELRVERIIYNGAPASLIASRDLSESKRIEMYEKLLPVCCVCGKIRDDSGGKTGEGGWERLDHYLSKHTDTQFSHTFCPDCFEDYKKQNLVR